MANDIELTPNREKAIVKFMFGNKDMKQLVKSAGLALESENRHLENCFNARLWKGSEQGICASWNERYYQFRIWSELMSSFRWRSETEWDRYDLAFFDNETDADTPVAVAEMKLWGSNSGLQELEAIQADINGLEILRIPGVMLIFTAHVTSEAKSNFDWLADHLGVNRSDMETASFPISTSDKGDWEFAIIGFLVTPR